MHISLIHLIPDVLRQRIDEEFQYIVQFKSELRYTVWPRLHKGVLYYLSDNPEKELILQACYQYLAHHHCIISTSLCGYSFSAIHINHGPIISNSASYWYLKSAISLIHHNPKIGDIDWLVKDKNELWSDICGVFLAYEYRYAESEAEIVNFAEKFAPMQKVKNYQKKADLKHHIAV
jgi:hypothetical protein